MFNNRYYKFRFSSLYHHGIKGQKWGVRNGPPYPLRRSYRMISKLTKAGNQLVDYKNRKSDIASETLPTLHDSIKYANPDWYKHRGDPRYEYNCSHSVLAFVARQKGLAVKATPMSKKEADEGGITPVELGMYFKGGLSDKDADVFTYSANFLNGSAKHYEKIAASQCEKKYKDAPNGAYGMMFCQTPVSGHFYIWYKENDAIKFADPQSGKDSATEIGFTIVAQSCRYYGYAVGASARLDDRELIPEKISEFSTPDGSELKHSFLSELYCNTYKPCYGWYTKKQIIIGKHFVEKILHRNA